MRYFSQTSIANSRQSQPIMQFGLPVRAPPAKLPSMPPQQTLLTQVSPSAGIVGRVKWGEPTWFMFHTLSCKIKEESFSQIRGEMLNTVYAICTNLPCPECSSHAKAFLDSVNFNTIQTKEDFKKLMHRFHNIVNQRKGYELFPYEELDSKYNVAITVNILQNFMVHFSDKSRSPKLLASDLHRGILVQNLKQWFNEKIHHFEP